VAVVEVLVVLKLLVVPQIMGRLVVRRVMCQGVGVVTGLCQVPRKTVGPDKMVILVTQVRAEVVAEVAM
jgi:hypothetical protein